MRVLPVVLLLVLAGCGGSDGNAPAPDKTTAAPTTATTKPTIAPATGVPAPEALSKFRCDQDAKKGSWRASGLLSNSGKTKVTYQVTVYIGPAAGGEEKARTKQATNVAAGGSVSFVINRVPAPEDGGPCHVQVLAQD